MQLPLVGHTSPNSRVCYIVGCNATGQASLSYCATLLPGLLYGSDITREQLEGSDKGALGTENDTSTVSSAMRLTTEQREMLSLLTIRRFALVPSVLELPARQSGY